MTAVGVTPRAPGRLAVLAAGIRRTAATAAVKVMTPHKAAMSRLADMPLTLAGVAGIDFAAFHVSHGWGWLVSGVSLVLIEHVIADPE